MSEKYKNKYRIKSARLQNWDYSWNGAYFITICTTDRKNYFGEIADNKMQLSNIGVLADVFWHEIKNHSNNIELGSFVVMPNHVHGILIITGNKSDEFPNNIIEARHALPLAPKTIGQKRFQNQGKNTVSSIIGSYKSAVSKHANRLGFRFAWQTRFYDHIIRNDESLEKISEYIIYNPQNWSKDKFYKNLK